MEKHYSKTITIRISEGQLKEIKEAAEEWRQSVGGWIREVIGAQLVKKESKEDKSQKEKKWKYRKKMSVYR